MDAPVINERPEVVAPAAVALGDQPVPATREKWLSAKAFVHNPVVR